VLDFDGLLCATPVALKRFHLVGEGAHQLVEGVLGAVLLLDGVHVRQPAICAASMASTRSRCAMPAITESTKLRFAALVVVDEERSSGLAALIPWCI
jgi:hypothetical protein